MSFNVIITDECVVTELGLLKVVYSEVVVNLLKFVTNFTDHEIYFGKHLHYLYVKIMNHL